MWKTREPKFAKLVRKYGDEIQRFSFASTPLPSDGAVVEAAGHSDASVAEAAAETPKAKKKPANDKPIRYKRKKD